MSHQNLIKKALSMLATLTVASNVSAKPTEKIMPMANINGMERCFGISKAHLNDCSTALHDCAGMSKTDRSKSEWILLPDGLCNKIVGGSTVSQDEKDNQ